METPKQTPNHELSADEMWQGFVTHSSDKAPYEKIHVREQSEVDVIGGRQLLRMTEYQAAETYPPIRKISGADMVITSPSNEQQLTYIRIVSGAFECYNIIHNQYGAKANLAQRFKPEDLSLTIPEGAFIGLSIQTEDGLNMGAQHSQQDEIVELFETCRDAADRETPEDISRPPRRQPRKLGLAVRRLIDY